MKKVLILGASSGIGLALSKEMLRNGYRVVGCGRSEESLMRIQEEFGDLFDFQVLDIRKTNSLETELENAIGKLGGMDICVISSGISATDSQLEWQTEQNIIQTNVTGFSQAAVFAAHYFSRQKHGHLAGISSLAKYFGNRNPAYNASKAFEAIYLDGLRLRLEGQGIFVTTILPGFVETPMTEGQKRMFWAAKPKTAARQILTALQKKRRYVFVTRRWRLFSIILPLLPFGFLKRIL